MKKLLLALAVCTSLVASAIPAGWSYSLPIDIVNNTGTTVYNYQVKVTVNTQTLIGNNQMLATGADIRFIKSCTSSSFYNYWIESGVNTTTTQIWVKLDTLLGNSTKRIYMIYGNSSASATSAVIGTFVGPHSSTDSVASGGAGGATNSQRGFRFSPNEDVLMYAVGKREPNGSTRTVTLFNFATQAIVTQQTVSGPAAQYSYNPLTTPIWLISGTQYVLELYQGASDGYYFGTSSQIGQHLTYLDMRYCNSCAASTFPTSVLSNYHYGYPDMWYFTKNNALSASLPTVTVLTPAGPTLTTTTSSAGICLGDSMNITASASGGGGAPFTFAWSPASGLSQTTGASVMASPPASSTYACTVTDVCGYTTTNSVPVIVHQLPVITITSSSDSVCSGDSTTLTAGGASTYTWTPAVSNGVAFAPSASGMYYVTGVDSNGCSNNDSTMIEVLALPTVMALASTDSVCTGSSVTLYGSGASTYSWSASVTDNVAFVPAATATYYVNGTDMYGCSDMDSVAVTVLPLPVVGYNASVTTACAGQPVTLSGTGAVSYTWDNGVTDGVAFIPSMSTTYMVTGSDMYGCWDTAAVYIPIDTVVADANASSSTVCSGSTVTLNANGGGTYLWLPGGQTTSSITDNPVSSATYTVIVTSAAGCSDTAYTQVNVNANPVVSANGPVTVCLSDGNYTLTGNPAGGTFAGPGVISNSFSPSTAGAGPASVVYMFTDSNGCTGSDSITIQVNDCVGIVSYNNGQSLTVSPNPFNDVLTLQLGMNEDCTVRIFNSLGQEMLNKQLAPGRHEIATGSFDNGIYFLQVSSGHESHTVKVVRN